MKGANLMKLQKPIFLAVMALGLSVCCLPCFIVKADLNPTNDADKYRARFMELYGELHNAENGYFSPEGIPYHSIETLMCEAPDYGHETTSEAFSYYMWLEAMYGKFSKDWTKLTTAWDVTEKYMIPTTLDQPIVDYNSSKPASYAAEWELPDNYPSQLDFSNNVGQDPISSELAMAYGTKQIYGMHWLLDVDNWYGFGKRGDGVGRPSYINTFQRGEQESVWETVPQPSWEEFKWGGPNGFLDLFTGDKSYAKQWRYTNAPDADARAVQAMYWADQWAKEQGADVAPLVGKASKMGDYLRYAMFDKYFKKIGCQDKSTGGNYYDGCHYLLSWYYAWGGAVGDKWSWKIGCSHNHFGYQNPMAAWVLSTQADFKPKSTNGTKDWEKSLTRQLEFYQWLQSAEGAIAGGATNSWNGRYEKYPDETATFYGMAYVPNPVYHDPGSNTWFGMQAWSMQRVAEYYYLTGDEAVGKLLEKWVRWVKSEVKLTANNGFAIPNKLDWTGQPETWTGEAKENHNLHVEVVDYGQDLGIAASLSNALLYYSAGTKKWHTYDDAARVLAKELLDRMWILYRDEKGLSVTEKREDYKRFFEQTVYIPNGWQGKMPNGDVIKPGVKFNEIRSKYKQDPDYQKLETAYKAGKAPEFNYHRFWAQCDIAIANGTYAILFGGEPTPSPLPSGTIVPSPSPIPSPTPSPTPKPVKLEMYNCNTSVNAGSLTPKIKVTNTGRNAIDLANLKIRYYYTIDGDKAQNYWCDHSSVSGNGAYRGVTVISKFVKLEQPKENADYYLELSFAADAGKIDPGQALEIQSRFAKTDWSNYNQANDYSFNSGLANYIEWENTLVYLSNNLIWGVEL